VNGESELPIVVGLLCSVSAG